MKLLKPISTLMLTGLLCSPAFCSRERFVPAHKVSIWANAGKAYGEVNTTIETISSFYSRRITSIIFVLGSKKHTVPRAIFKYLQYPLIETAEFRTETGVRHGGSPWLYLRFKLDMPNTKSPTDYQLCYIRFRNGKLQETRTSSYGS